MYWIIIPFKMAISVIETLIYYSLQKSYNCSITCMGRTSDLPFCLRALSKEQGGGFWGLRAGQRADQLTSIGVSETESWCVVSGGDMWFTTWPCCLTHWSAREEQGQPVQPFAHQWRASLPLNTAYRSAQPAAPQLCVHFLLIISSLFLLTASCAF